MSLLRRRTIEDMTVRNLSPYTQRNYLFAVSRFACHVRTSPAEVGPDQVLDYLGRYTHRVAIANSRLTEIGDSTVSFGWKDYRHHDRRKIMTLDAHEFIRRFLLHVLPDGF